MNKKDVSIGLASISIIGGTLLFSGSASAQSTQPVADGSRIQFPTSGYWLVRDSGSNEICQGSSSNGVSNNYGTSGRCENLASGTYSVENLSSAGTADDASVVIGQGNGGSETGGGNDNGTSGNNGNSPIADGARIQFPTTGYWLVRNSSGIEICQGSSSNGVSNNYGTSGRCENLESGTYSVENLSSAGTADDAVVVIGQGNSDGGTGGGEIDNGGNNSNSPIPDGARIQFPTTGYWLIRNSAGVEICQGSSSDGISNDYGNSGSCENLANGTYSAENLSSQGTADDAVVVITQGTSGGGIDDDTDEIDDGGNTPVDQASPRAFDLQLSGRTLIWRVANSIVDAESFGFQLTQSQFANNDRVEASNEVQFRTRRWTHAGSAHTLTSRYQTNRGAESTEFRFDLSNLVAWIPGTTFDVQTYSSTGSFQSYQGVLRKATVPASGNPQPAGNFLSTFGAGANGTSRLAGSFIGTRSDWSEIPDFDEEFLPIYQNGESGNQLLRTRNNRITNASSQAWRWYFGRDNSNGITPSPDRDDGMDNDHAVLTSNGVLVMELESTSDTTAEYSYLGTDNDGSDARNQPTNGYTIDPTGGVFIEASVRLDEATPAAQAWWAFWLMATGDTAYNCNAADGSEVDIFEMVPDQNNGFNAKLFRDEGNCPNVTDSFGLNDSNGNPLGFTYEGPQSPNLPASLRGLPNYMDGNFHRIGMYYDEENYAFYIDDKQFFELPVNQREWITTEQALSIRLTWELQQVLGRFRQNNTEIKNPWNINVPGGGGVHGDMIRTGNPTVYIDWVKVWKKAPGTNRANWDRGENVTSKPVKATLTAPIDRESVSARSPVELSWVDEFSATKYRTRVYDRNRPGWTPWVEHVAEDICINDACKVDGPALQESRAANVFWQVNAGNDLGWSGATAARDGTFRVFEDEKPPIPAMVSPLSGDTVSANAPVTLTWEADTDALRYRVQRYDRITRSWSYNEIHWNEDVCSGSTCSIEVPETGAHNASFWRVIGWNRRGWGTWSDHRATRFNVVD